MTSTRRNRRRRFRAILTACLFGIGTASCHGPIATPPSRDATGAKLTETDAVRLAKQATFGPTEMLVRHMTSLSANAWLDEQFLANGSNYRTMLDGQQKKGCKASVVRQTYCDCMFQKGVLMQMQFYNHALSNDDQLRQRTAFALSQIFVVPETINASTGVIVMDDNFLDQAFGNYRDIIRMVTLNAGMGDYLNLAGSDKAAPNENYARELMQLFTMGPDRLGPDGTPLHDNTGATVANYGAADVRDIARALTGWTWDTRRRWLLFGAKTRVFSTPMVRNAKSYDDGAKHFLGTTVPAGASQEASLEAVVDAVFRHPSTPPFVARFFIQQFVMSNPSPGYVRRVAAAFVDNGSGVRGDMKAMLRAILTDPEARRPGTGKVKEPVLLMTSIARLVGMRSDGWAFVARDKGMEQRPFDAPSVFNFYPPDYPLPLSNGVTSPPGKLIDTATVAARHNLIYDWTLGSGNRCEFARQPIVPGSTGTQIDWSRWQSLGANIDHTLDRIDLLMLNGTMTPSQRSAVRAAMLAVNDKDPTIRARRRAQTALYIVGTSPLFQVDR